MSLAICPSTVHRHPLTCARCGVSDLTVAQTIVKDGTPWPPTCSDCAAIIRAKSARIAALVKAVGDA
jgi:hypothetical protein